MLDRRTFLVVAGASGVMARVAGIADARAEAAAEESAEFKATLAALLGNAATSDEGLNS